MSLKDDHEALGIMLKYEPDGFLQSGHDIIYGIKEDLITDRADRERMVELSWFIYEEDNWATFT